MPRTSTLLSSTAPRRLIGISGVCARYKPDGQTPISSRSIDRWIEAGAFPRPDCIIQRRRFWDEASLDKFDRQRVVDHAAAKTQPNPSTNETDQVATSAV